MKFWRKYEYCFDCSKKIEMTEKLQLRYHELGFVICDDCYSPSNENWKELDNEITRERAYE